VRPSNGDYYIGEGVAMRFSEDEFRRLINTIPALAWSGSSDGSVESFNRNWLEYTGLSLKEALGWGWKVAIHPDDLPRMLERIQGAINSGQPFEVEGRVRRYDGEFRRFLLRGSSLHDESGRVLKWYGTYTSLEDLASSLKQAEHVLDESEQNFRQIVDGIPGMVGVMNAEGEIEFVNKPILDYFGKPLEELKNWSNAIHPDDLQKALGAWMHSVKTGDRYDVDHRILRADGVYRWHNASGLALRDAEGRVVRWQILVTDIDERKRAEENHRRSEAYLSEAQQLSHTGSFGWDVGSGALYWSPETFRIFEYEPTKITIEQALHRIHPADMMAVEQLMDRITRDKTDCDLELRLLMPDGSVKYLRVVGRPRMDEWGSWEFVGAVTDITERKRAEDSLRRSEDALRADIEARKQVEANLLKNEAYLLEVQALTRTGSFRLDVATGKVTASPEALRQYAPQPDEDPSKPEFWFGRLHPEDSKRSIDLYEYSLRQGTDYEVEYRIVLPTGAVQHEHVIGHPILNGKGELIEVVGTVAEINQRVHAREKLEAAFAEIKGLKDRLQKENVALREEIDRSSLFDEIVGSSEPLRRVQIQVAKVAPADATVLILGETGTGKELMARAVHRRSKRSSEAFIPVNCAAIPHSLIASELFGHEKGAFTGAVERRIGRFESADKGTIFLDEIGELPAETQAILLRVLQEREFQRVGGTRPIRVDVRVVAATNRDLKADVEVGKFRQDLYYRLSVFPIQVPSLRERADDIPLLVEYFIARYAQRAGKRIEEIEKDTLDLLRDYHWPGNIRELQNVVERAVILSEGGTFSLDENWLTTPPADTAAPVNISFEGMLRLSEERQKELIEGALSASGGRVSGAYGAARKLGIPRQTLESKIATLGIDKNRYKSRQG
jgi:PAS domain S-box-containing protein